MSKIKSVLFVCTGNSCRSIMAEGLLKKYLKELGKDDIEVKSAGVAAADGVAVSSETIEVMHRNGADVSEYRSKYLTDELIKRSDLILVMTAQHMDEVIRRVPQAAPKVHLLKQYGVGDDTCPCEDLDIPDPIGKSSEVYECVFETIKEEVKRIADIL